MTQVGQPISVPSPTGLSDAPPDNKQDWLHPVIFEPQNKIQLTRSTYQVTTFLDFAPFMNGFNNIQNYIRSFKEDISNPTYFSKIKHKSTNTGSSPLLDEQDLEAFMQSDYCQQLPYAYMTRLKIDRFLMEIKYLDDLFNVVYQKFLNAIDHINTILLYKTNQLLKQEVNVLFSSPKQVFITLLIADLALQKNYFWKNFL